MPGFEAPAVVATVRGPGAPVQASVVEPPAVDLTGFVLAVVEASAVVAAGASSGIRK